MSEKEESVKMGIREEVVQRTSFAPPQLKVILGLDQSDYR